MLHGAGIFTYIYPSNVKWPSFVGKYSSTMEHMGHFKTNQQQRFGFFFGDDDLQKKWH